MKLLLVDDAEDVHLLARVFLRRNKHPELELISARDGREGLEAARREAPDLVLTDVNMPSMSGLEMLDALQADPATRDLRVVLIGSTTDTPTTHPGAIDSVDKRDLLDDFARHLARWLP